MARPLHLIPAGLALLAAAACAAPPPAPRATEAPDVIALDALQPQEPHSTALWTAARAHWTARASGWSYTPPRKAGGQLQERWCAPAVPADACRTGRVATQPQPGWSYATLSQYFYGDTFPAVFGFSMEAGQLPADGTWGAQLTISLRGRKIGGSSFGIALRRVRDGQLADRVTLGDTLSYKVGETTFKVGGPPAGADDEARALAVEAELARYLSSPDGFKAHALAQLDALLAEVERGIEAHEARKGVQGEYKGGGVPPEITLVPLDAVEETTALSKAVAELGATRALIEADAPAMHAAIAALAPASIFGSL